MPADKEEKKKLLHSETDVAVIILYLWGSASEKNNIYNSESLDISFIAEPQFIYIGHTRPKTS